MLARADLDIARYYEELSPPALRHFGEQIRAEYRLACEQVLAIKGSRELLDSDPTLQRSIRLRNPYVDPMNLMQVDLLRRWRAGAREDHDLFAALLAQRRRHCRRPAKHRMSSAADAISIRPATPADVPLVLSFIRELAVYERLAAQVSASEADLAAALFGPRPYAEVVFACLEGAPVGFALFFHNFSTFLGKPGIYLEDLFVRPQARGRGVGRRLLAVARAHDARARGRAARLGGA